MALHPERGSNVLAIGVVMAVGSLAVNGGNSYVPAPQLHTYTPDAHTMPTQERPDVADIIKQGVLVAIDEQSLAIKLHVKAPATHHDQPKPAPLPKILLRIGGCESAGSPTAKINYRAANPTSTATGGFQFLDSSWDDYGGYSRAMYAPPAVQNRKAEETLREDGTAPWVSSESCWS